MLIYRVEHREDRNGPYNCLNVDLRRKMGDIHYKDPERPVWCEDGLVGKFEPWKDHRFGFNALEKAFDWFDNALEYLDEFLLVTYECPEDAVILSESGRQVVFEFGKAKSLGEILFLDAYILGNAPIVKTH